MSEDAATFGLSERGLNDDLALYTHKYNGNYPWRDTKTWRFLWFYVFYVYVEHTGLFQQT